MLAPNTATVKVFPYQFKRCSAIFIGMDDEVAGTPLARYLDRKIREAGLSRNALAMYAKLSPTTLHNVLVLGKTPRPETLQKLAAYRSLRASLREMYELAGYARAPGEFPAAPEVPETEEDLLRRLMARIRERKGAIKKPVVGFAGAGEAFVQEVYLPAELEQRAENIIPVGVRGSCMEPELFEGDVVFVDKELPAQEGDMVVAYPDSETAVVKWLSMRNGRPWLDPNNPHGGQEPIPVREGVTILGPVVGQYRPRRRRRVKN